MADSKLTSELIAGFGAREEVAAAVDLLLGNHPFEDRALSELEERAGNHVLLLGPDAYIQGLDGYGAALRMWRDAFHGWRPDHTTLGSTASIIRQRWEYVQPHILPFSCTYFFSRTAPRTTAQNQQINDARREAFQRLVRAVRDRPSTRSMPTWVVPLSPSKEFRDIFEKIAGLVEPTRRRLGLDLSESGFLVRYAATLEAGLEERLHPRQFEYLIAEVYEAEGWRCEVSPYSRDGGIDVVASRDEDGEETVLLIQAKRYRSSSSGRRERPVGLDSVKSFAATVRARGRERGVLVSTSRFTKGATSWARGDGRLVADVDLVDGAELGRRLRRIGDEMSLRGSVAFIFDKIAKS